MAFWIAALAISAAAGWTVNLQRCEVPNQMVVAAFCTSMSLRVRENAARSYGSSNDRRLRLKSGSTRTPRRWIGQDPAVAPEYTSPSAGAVAGQIVSSSYANSGTSLSDVRARLGDVKSLPYDGQAMADQALGAMSTVAPDMAADPVTRAGLRVGGAALDAGRAVDHVIGPNVNAAASKVDQLLSTWRRK